MMTANALLVEQAKIVPTLVGVVPSSSVPQRVSLKNYGKVTFLILAKNGGSGVVGSAVTLLQSTTVGGAGEKAVPFAYAHRNVDLSAGDVQAGFAVTGNTFILDPTVSKNLLYTVEVKPGDLDVDNAFDCVRVGVADATAQTVTILAILWPARFGGSALPSAVVD